MIWTDKIVEYLKDVNPNNGLAVASVIGLVGTVLFIFFTYRNGIKAGVDSEKLMSTVDQTNATTGRIDTRVVSLSDENKNLKKEVAELRKENQSLREAIIVTNNNITGGNSSCYLEFIPTASPTLAHVFLRQIGEVPLHEIDIYIVNNLTNNRYEKHYTIVKASREMKFVMSIPFNGGATNLFSVYISSFNDNWNEQVLVEPATSSARGVPFEAIYRVYKLRRDEKNVLNYHYTFIKEGRQAGANGMQDIGRDDWTPYRQHFMETGLILEKSFGRD